MGDFNVSQWQAASLVDAGRFGDRNYLGLRSTVL